MNHQIWRICYPFKEGSAGTLLVLRCVLCVKSTEMPCSGRHPHYPHALPQDAVHIAFLFKFIYLGTVYSVQYLNHKVNCLLLWTIDKKSANYHTCNKGTGSNKITKLS